MSALPLMIEGSALTALVVGGGTVGTRKALALLECGATVRVVAPDVTVALRAAAASSSGALSIVRAPYTERAIGDAMLVVAATDSPELNAQIAADAQRVRRLVNVVSAPEVGNCATAAVHRVGGVTIGVTAGGVPGAASRIRDAIAASIDDRYADAVDTLAELRRSLIDGGDRARWTAAARALLGADFVARVESGELAARVAQWR